MFKNINFLVLCIGIIITISWSGMDFITYRIEKDLFSCYIVKITDKSFLYHDDIGKFKCDINNKMYNGSVKCNVWEEVGDEITVATSAGNLYLRTCFLLTRTVCFMIIIDIFILIKWVVEYYFGMTLNELGDKSH